ncbi:MAG: hypothetical protein MJ246_03940 [Clostridia bacterium]|nr:hypothetical protein [Clostridia bacterium]
MKKKVLTLIMIAMLSLMFTGCEDYPELDENAKCFDFSVVAYKSPEGYDEGIQTIEYNGRQYGFYGTLKNYITPKDVDKCVGYLNSDINEVGANTDTRIYTLVDDPDNNYLLEYYIADTEMNQPTFLRAIDTNGMEIDTPSYIERLDYDY